ncbi:MAG: hypothetical protein ABL921_19530 [Pirellula sp.]
MRRIPLLLISLISALAHGVAAGDETNPLPGVRWQVEQLALDANEGCAIGDVNGDGKQDVLAGRNWYPAPDFKPQPLRVMKDWNGYVQSNGDFLMDVNGDGRIDVIAGSFLPTEVSWYENPSAEGLRLGLYFAKKFDFVRAEKHEQ